MTKLILVVLMFPLAAFPADLSKCNIDDPDDPNNKPKCYMNFPEKLTAGMKTRGWPAGTKLMSAPDGSSNVIAELSTSDHWVDEQIELTGNFKGEWAEVVLRKFHSKLQSCDSSPKEKWKRKGWIKAADRSGKPIIWEWLYTGLC